MTTRIKGKCFSCGRKTTLQVDPKHNWIKEAFPDWKTRYKFCCSFCMNKKSAFFNKDH